MKAHAIGVLLAAIIAVPAWTACTRRARGPATSPTTLASSRDSLDETVHKVRGEFETKGYQVAQGSWNLFEIEDCRFVLKTLGNCLGNNPAAPYLIPSVPLWEDEFVDDHMKDLLGPAPGDTWWTYRLGEREALVVLGRLPPPGAYFGLQTYLFTRKGVTNTADEIYQSLSERFMRDILFMKSPNPSRVLVFASVGDSNNNVVIQRQSGSSSSPGSKRRHASEIRGDGPPRNEFRLEHRGKDDEISNARFRIPRLDGVQGFGCSRRCAR